MILVIGNTPKRVELKDLDDSVYYKQQKVFSEAEYAKSSDLKRELKKGALTILKRVAEKNGSFDLPDAIPFSNETVPRRAASDVSDMGTVLERIDALEKSLTEKGAPPTQDGILSEIAAKIVNLEKKLSERPAEDASGVTNAIKRLEEKIEGNQKSNDVVDRLESLLSQIQAGRQYSTREEGVESTDEVYVPNVSVEDVNSQIKLDVRTVEKSDTINDSLRKLRELKKEI